MEGNQAHADRMWDRLAKRGWILRLEGPEPQTATPYKCTVRRAGTLLEGLGTTRVEAVLRCAKVVEEDERRTD